MSSLNNDDLQRPVREVAAELLAARRLADALAAVMPRPAVLGNQLLYWREDMGVVLGALEVYQTVRQDRGQVAESAGPGASKGPVR